MTTIATRTETLQTVPDAINVADPVTVVKFEHDRPDNVIETRTEPPAGYDGTPQFAGVEIYIFAWTGHLQPGAYGPPFQSLLHVFQRRIDQHPLIVGHEILPALEG